MCEEKRSRDKRKSFRCAVAGLRQPCETEVGSQTLSACLLDESAGGFAVLVDYLGGLQVNQKAKFRRTRGYLPPV